MQVLTILESRFLLVQKEMKIYLQNNINLFTIDSQPDSKNCYNISVIKR